MIHFTVCVSRNVVCAPDRPNQNFHGKRISRFFFSSSSSFTHGVCFTFSLCVAHQSKYQFCCSLNYSYICLGLLCYLTQKFWFLSSLSLSLYRFALCFLFSSLVCCSPSCVYVGPRISVIVVHVANDFAFFLLGFNE